MVLLESFNGHGGALALRVDELAINDRRVNKILNFFFFK